MGYDGTWKRGTLAVQNLPNYQKWHGVSGKLEKCEACRTEYLYLKESCEEPAKFQSMIIN